jgi:hypothetical protein
MLENNHEKIPSTSGQDILVLRVFAGNLDSRLLFYGSNHRKKNGIERASKSRFVPLKQRESAEQAI